MNNLLWCVGIVLLIGVLTVQGEGVEVSPRPQVGRYFMAVDPDHMKYFVLDTATGQVRMVSYVESYDRYSTRRAVPPVKGVDYE